ncbi:adenylate kinase 2 [Angomonas deanei]|nr:adenylate kinase 2 [Angomonas deanei]|eukprot:EPY38600.1 adenylate kinase 2 [Angomonas deanei]
MQIGNSQFSSTVKQIIDNGEVIPDTLLVKVVSEAIRRPDCINGFVLDGFPRTKKQATLMQDFEKISADAVIELGIPASVMQQRFGGRYHHPASGRMYHTVYNPPEEAGKDDITGEPLVQNNEDKPEAIAQRMQAYQKQVADVRSTFTDNQWVPVDASGNVESVRNNVFTVLDPLQFSVFASKVTTARPWWKFW